MLTYTRDDPSSMERMKSVFATEHNPGKTLLSELLTICRAYAIQTWMMPANMAEL